MKDRVQVFYLLASRESFWTKVNEWLEQQPDNTVIKKMEYSSTSQGDYFWIWYTTTKIKGWSQQDRNLDAMDDDPYGDLQPITPRQEISLVK